MKYLKTFEDKKDDMEVIEDFYDEIKKDRQGEDLYLFIGSDDFVETKNGMYKKTVDIENMVRITPDEKSIGAIRGMSLRAKFVSKTLYQIWLPEELRDQVEGKGSVEMNEYLVDIINKYKTISRSTEESRKIMSDAKKRQEDKSKFGL